MKKTIRTIGLTFMAVSVMPFVSCDKDDDGGVTPPSDNKDNIVNVVATETGLHLKQVGNYYFDYNDKGVPVGVYYYSYGEGYEIDWNKGIITYTDESDMGNIHFTTNGQGYITEASQSWSYIDGEDSYKGSGNATFSYDGSGHITSIVFSSSESGMDEGERFNYKGKETINLTWKDGNLVKMKSRYEETENSYKEVYEYTADIAYGSDKNEFKQWCYSLSEDILDFEFSEFAHIGMLGVGTKNFPVSIHVESVNEDDVDSSSSDRDVEVYTDGNGLISSEQYGYQTIDYRYESAGEDDEMDTPLPHNVVASRSGKDMKKSRSFFPLLHKARK